MKLHEREYELDPPEAYSQHVERTRELFFRMTPDYYVVNHGEAFSFTADNNVYNKLQKKTPRGSFFWEKGGVKVEPKSEDIQVSKFGITISRVDRTHTGIWALKFQYSAGRSIILELVNIEVKHKIPTLYSENQQQVELLCNTDGFTVYSGSSRLGY